MTKTALLISTLFIVTFTLQSAHGAPRSKNANDTQLKRGLQLYQSKNYLKASEVFYRLTKVQLTPAQRQKAQLFLGLSFYRLNLRQMSAFPLVQLVREGSRSNRKKALDVLVAVADSLDETSLLDYSLSMVTPEELSETGLSVVYYRLGELALKKNETDRALSHFRNSLGQKGDSSEALYSLGMTYLIRDQPESAIPYFQKLLEKYDTRSTIDRKRGMATLGLARSYYQAKKWSQAAEAYRLIPKDHVFYRESLMELSWSLFRGGQFRSALSPLQTLHTPFYNNFFDPESLLLHGIILLFSCRYDEIAPLLKTFDENYPGSIAKVREWIESPRSVQDYFDEINRAVKTLREQKRTGEVSSANHLPFFVIRTLLQQNDISVEMRYLNKLRREELLLKRLYGGGYKSPVLEYGSKIIAGRAKASRTRMAVRLQDHLKKIVDSYGEFALQVNFLKYEMLGGMRTSLKDKMASSGTESQSLGQDRGREFYVKNGYRYWPFQGEFWRDEMGSYQYVGVNVCESK
jgi:tetratricopeptide (TPR) repeat protein